MSRRAMVEVKALRQELARFPGVSRVLGADEEFGIVIIGGREHARDTPASAWHRQSNWALNFVLEGRARFFPSRGGVVALEPGWFYVRKPGSRARVAPDFARGFAEFYVVADPRTAAALTTLHLTPEREVGQAGLDVVTLQAWLKFARLCAEPAATARRVVMLELIALFALLQQRAAASTLPSPNEAAVRRAAGILSANLPERLELPDVAARVGLSYTTLRREFRRVHGVAPGEYRIRRRIEAATTMLAGARVSEVAGRLGYSDAFAFSAQFKKMMGVSPRAFRDGLRAAPPA